MAGIGKTSSTLELHVQCQNLIKKDVTSESDPCCVMFIQQKGPNGQLYWAEAGRTETIKNAPNPKFSKFFTIEYFFEEVQKLQFRVYDMDSKSHELDDHDSLGGCFAELGEIVGSKGNAVEKTLIDDKRRMTGHIRIAFEEKSTAPTSQVILSLAGRNLDDLDRFSKSDPFYVIKRTTESGSHLPVAKSNTIMNNLNPVWQTITTTTQVICNNDIDRPLIIEVYDYEKNGKHELIGECQVSFRQLSTDPSLSTAGIPLINKEKKERRAKKNKAYENSGVLLVRQCSAQRIYSFLDFLKGGLEISLMVSVDFTASNGDPHSHQSLHSLNPQMPNSYEAAITAVGSVLANYDADQKFPAWGFGGQVNGLVSHCFALNGNPADPEVHGVGGILQAYREALNHVSLSGPTLFLPSLQNASAIAHNHIGKNKYFILLLLTDGQNNDQQNTIDQIVTMSKLPISVVIAGVGSADFSQMHVLDSDERALVNSRGQAASRDCVQFVAMRDYKLGMESRLAADTLREIPGQVVAYMADNRIIPHSI